MPSFLRTFIVACIFLGVTLGLVTTIAAAKTLHKHHVAHHTTTHHASKGDTHLRSAQSHLINLGYYTGKADGLMGPKTKAALKHFQRDHHLAVNGKLTPKTYAAILEADRKAPHMMTAMDSLQPVPPENFYATHPDFYGHYDQQYGNPLLLSDPQPVPTRYGKVDISKNAGGQGNYSVTLNGQPILSAEEQPSVIGLSQTYGLGIEDVIIVSTYRNQSSICPYKNYLLTLRDGSNKVQEIGNCTHGYQASVKEGSLWIVFPEENNGRVVGDTWRYENGDLEKL